MAALVELVEFAPVALLVAAFVGVLFSPSLGAFVAAVFFCAFDFLPLHTGCAPEHVSVSTK